MVEISINSQIQKAQAGNGFNQKQVYAAKWAEELFDESYKSATRSRVWSWFRPNKPSLFYLNPASLVKKKGPARPQLVSLDLIKGSCGGRFQDFDAGFRPRKQHNKVRWLSVAMTFYLNKPLPPVVLVEVDGYYFVIDGHHRLSVAQSVGLEAFWANVTECHLAKPA